MLVIKRMTLLVLLLWFATEITTLKIDINASDEKSTVVVLIVVSI